MKGARPGPSFRQPRLSVRMRPQVGTVPEKTVDRVIAGIASRSHGVVSRSELLEAGVSPPRIRRRIEKGVLIVVHRGVYRVGHQAPSREALYIAAVKACGNRSAVCGLAAAHLWGLIKGSLPRPEVLGPVMRQVPGVVTHRAYELQGSELTSWRGIPLTSVPRTLVDLASSLSKPALARACHEAEVIHHTTPAQVEEVLALRSNARGVGALRRILHGGMPISLSRLESRFLERLRAARLPLPATNQRVGGFRVDCRWPEHRLTVELDSYRFHNSRHSWEKDRLREREARARGDEFRRYAPTDVFEDPAFMLCELRSLLGQSELRST